MLLARQAVTAAAGGVGVTIAVVVVPDGANVAGIGFEEQFGHCEHAPAV
jgi:hypothetical protein